VIVLAVDTATPRASVAVCRGEDVLARASSDGTKNHSETLLGSMVSVLHEARISLGDVTLLAVGLGPGAFTALRVGITTMKALSFGLSIPLVGISTLDVMAAGVTETMPTYRGDVAPVIDARKGEVYTALFRIGDDGKVVRIGEYRAIPREEFCRMVEPDVLVLGRGVTLFSREEQRTMTIARESIWDPDSSLLAKSARTLFQEKGGGTDPEEIVPLYVRRSDAEINRDKMLDRDRGER
jgi:tRNA threonylcarbamoyladenosine biosynthesis protein TsaB